MAKYQVTLQAEYDDVASNVTITGMGPPPAGPADLVEKYLWFPQTGPGFSFTLPVSKRNLTPNPTAIYIVPGSEPVEKRLVQYLNGAWQLPGTIVTE